MKSKHALGLILFLTGAVAAVALEVSTSNPSGIFTSGETVAWSVSSKDKPPVRYRIIRDSGQVVREGSADLKDGSARIEIAPDQPGTLLLELNAGGGDVPKEQVFGGALVEPGKIARSSPRPADFDAFWNQQLAELAKVPPNPQLTPGKSGKKEIAHEFLEMDLPRGAKLRGQVARPDGNEKLPAIIQFQYAGIYPLPAWNVVSKAAEGWLAVNINAHDLPLDQPKEFYQQQEKGALKSYTMIGCESRESSYFLRMFLACSRAVDYVASRPDWDGRTLVVTGTSQGGLQAVVAAALNPKVTAMIVNVPAGCDTTAPLAGRGMSWPYWMKDQREEVVQTSRYFDALNFAPRVKCPSLVAFGLLDRTATPSGVHQLTGQLGGPVEKLLMTASDHKGNGGTQAPFKTRSKEWLDALKTGKPPQ
jgi:cephalosporin-C deacetylase-like acetyl esterase